VLRKRGDPDPALFKLLADLTGSPRIKRALDDREPFGQLVDDLGDVEHRPVAGQDLAADVQALVHPHHGAVGPLAADV
jgi:hypothetical protein